MHAPPPLLFFLNDQEKLTPYPTQKEAAGKPEVAAECVCVCVAFAIVFMHACMWAHVRTSMHVCVGVHVCVHTQEPLVILRLDKH